MKKDVQRNKSKFYDKLLQSEEGIEEGLTKAASILAGISYVSNDKIRNTLKGVNFAVGMGMAAHAVFRFVRDAQEDSMYSLTVNDLDEGTFEVASNILEEFQEEKSVKSFTLRTKFESIPLSNKNRKVLVTETDQDTVVRMRFEGYDYQGYLAIPEAPAKGEKNTNIIGIRTITFYCKKSEGVEVLKKELQKRVDARDKKGVTPVIYVNGDYGFNASDMRIRPIESVVLKEGQIESAITHIERFLSYEEQHNKYGLPYHTGILLKGPPGTGKTSLVTGLASHFQTNMYQISLSTIDGDDDLIDTFSGIKPRSIVVLEDLDVLAASNVVDRDAEYEKDTVTMSGLLNILDGNMTPHGMILIATTNDAESIDPAITRSGRIDMTMTLDYMDNDQLDRLVKFFTGKTYEFPTITQSDQVTSSDVSGLFRSHLDNTENAIEDIRKMIEDKKVLSIAELG